MGFPRVTKLPVPNTPGALCAAEGQNPDMWFAEDRQTRQQAAEICRMCPAQRPCLEWAIRNHRDLWGMWGGVWFRTKHARVNARAYLRAKKRKG